MENSVDKYSHIKGWNIDADPKNEPTYPMKKYTGDDHKRLDYEKPQQQEVNTEILHSNERPSVSSVFGTTLPPTGLSGAIRRFAFKFSESSFGHWFPLLLADRINVVEGILEDMGKGKIPNVFTERGLKSEWQHNRPNLVRKVAVGAAVTAAVMFLLFAGRKKGKNLTI